MEKVIALSANYGYIDKVETTIKSILYNVKNVEIYLLNYDIPKNGSQILIVMQIKLIPKLLTRNLIPKNCMI